MSKELKRFLISSVIFDFFLYVIGMAVAGALVGFVSSVLSLLIAHDFPLEIIFSLHEKSPLWAWVIPISLICTVILAIVSSFFWLCEWRAVIIELLRELVQKVIA